MRCFTPFRMWYEPGELPEVTKDEGLKNLAAFSSFVFRASSAVLNVAMVTPAAYQMDYQTQDEENRKNSQQYPGDKGRRPRNPGEPEEGSRYGNQEKQDCCS